MDELISVIIPVYNVEEYLNRCVESVVNQEYTNLEIILVDDGSIDQSGSICDSWMKKDRRIHVIHKSNGGLSDARNKGIDAASGSYLSFIDSDDYISAEMIQKLYQALIMNDADLSICNFVSVDESGNKITKKYYLRSLEDRVISEVEAIDSLCQDGAAVFIGACNKLYKKEIFKSIRFPKGRLFEDALTMHHIYARCKKIACIHDIGYFYFQRSNSIMGSLRYRPSANNTLDSIEIALDRIKTAVSSGLKRSISDYYFNTGLLFSEVLLFNLTSDETKRYHSLLHQFRHFFYLSQYCTIKKKMHLFLLYSNPQIHRFLVKTISATKTRSRNYTH